MAGRVFPNKIRAFVAALLAICLAFPFSVLAQETPKQGAIKGFIKGGPAFAKDTITSLPKDSGDLLVQLTITKGIESFLEKDPLLLSEFVQQQVDSPILTPTVLAVFHGFAKPTSKLTTKLFVLKYGEKAVQASQKIKFVTDGAGLAVGSLGTRILFDALAGNIDKDIHNAKEREKLKSSLFGLAPGFATSTAVGYGGSSLLALAGWANPYTAAVLTVGSGVSFFLASDKYEKWRNGRVLYGIEKKNLNKLLAGLPGKLEAAGRAQVCDPKTDSYDAALMNLAHGFVALRSEIDAPVLNAETKYLKAIINVRADQYRKVKLSEWARAGYDDADPDVKTNALDWRDQKFPLNESIQISLYPETTEDVTTRYINEVNNDARMKIEDLGREYQKNRIKNYDAVLKDPRFAQSFQWQLGILLNHISKYSEFKNDPRIAQAKKILSDPKNLFKNSDSLLGLFEGIAGDFLQIQPKMGECQANHLESLLSHAISTSQELSLHAKKRYFDDIVTKSSNKFEKILESLKNGQKPADLQKTSTPNLLNGSSR